MTEGFLRLISMQQPMHRISRKEPIQPRQFPDNAGSTGRTDLMEDRLGLGTNLFSGTKTLLEEFGNSKVNAELKKKV